MIERGAIENVLAPLESIETELSRPETAANQKRFRKLVQEHARLKKLEKKAENFLSLQQRLAENLELIAEGGDEELCELATMENEEIETSLPGAERELMFSLLPPDPADVRNAMMEVRAGTGGDEAALFAGDLFRMYSRYAEDHGWKIEVIDAGVSEVGGYKDVTFKVVGDGAYGRLRFESGGHRVQRVPTTESQGRIHTSAATVAVFPEADVEDALEIKPEDVRIDIYRASGAGGQHVNTTDSAVRITHLESGIVVQSQDERSQHRNKDRAMSVLLSRLLDQRRREEAEKMGSARRAMVGSGDRSQRVRTYNFPQNRLTDHRIGLTLYSLDRVVEGGLDELLRALSDHDMELRLKEELEQQTV
jgi:peptide chain release factor 1